MTKVYRIVLVDESGNIHPIMDPDDNLLNYDLAKSLARAEIVEQIVAGIHNADAARGLA
jgi:hypothetical protein